MTEVTLSNSSGQTINLVEYGGRYYPPFPNIAVVLDNIRRMKFRDDDVIVTSYASSGSYWVWEIVNMLLLGEDRSIRNSKEELFLEMTSQRELDTMTSPRVLNTHVFPDLFSSRQLENRKMIYVCRNPKDAIVSNFFHVFSFLQYEFQGDFQGFCELAMEGKVGYDAWWDHINAWEAYSRSQKDLDLMTVYYEDLKENLGRGVQQLAKFLDVDANPQLVRDIADRCTFKHMKVDKEKSYPEEKKILWRDGKYTLFRKGQVGDWKNHFTVALNEMFDCELQNNMNGRDIMRRIRYTL